MARKLVVNMTMTIELHDDESNGEHDASNAKCPYCGWSRAYNSVPSAKRGMAAHLPHCKKRSEHDAISNQIIGQFFNGLAGKK
jgi:hypothetical protein